MSYGHINVKDWITSSLDMRLSCVVRLHGRQFPSSQLRERWQVFFPLLTLVRMQPEIGRPWHPLLLGVPRCNVKPPARPFQPLSCSVLVWFGWFTVFRLSSNDTGALGLYSVKLWRLLFRLSVGSQHCDPDWTTSATILSVVPGGWIPMNNDVHPDFPSDANMTF